MLDKIEQLFAEQIASWPLLTRGTDALKQVQTRNVDLNGFTVWIRHLPHRIASTTAAVDPASVEKRPCFLCSANLPPEEKGLPFNAELTIYCNPFPILDRHMTIVHKDHRPQRIENQVENLFALAESMPGYFIIYNGPECGASAPDHLHFQACSVGGVPIVDDVKKAVGRTIPDYGRQVWVVRNPNQLKEAIARWNDLSPRDPEPLLNLAVFRRDSGMVATLFPRRKHRPAAYYTGEFTVSPATIDLCGVFVTPVEKDFQTISGEDIRRIFQEVS